MIERKFGRFSEVMIRQAVADDRERLATVTSGWRRSHSCVIDAKGDIVAMEPYTQGNLYRSGQADPAKAAANARFIVSARTTLERRCEIIEELLRYISEIEG